MMLTLLHTFRDVSVMPIYHLKPGMKIISSSDGIGTVSITELDISGRYSPIYGLMIQWNSKSTMFVPEMINKYQMVRVYEA